MGYFGLGRYKNVQSSFVSLGLSVLPMGFTWAFYLAQHAHVHLLRHDVGISVESLMQKARPVPHISRGVVSVLAYCDNLAVASTDCGSCGRIIQHGSRGGGSAKSQGA